MGKMISTTEELAELLAEVDCAITEPADAASKGRRVRCAILCSSLDVADYAKLLAVQFLSSSKYRSYEKLVGTIIVFLTTEGAGPTLYSMT